MIQYALRCGAGHDFDAWFRNSAAYGEQEARGIIACPVCNSTQVEKALMAPALARGGGKDTVTLTARHPEQERMVAMMRALRDKMTESADYVGPRFAEEARMMHAGEIDPRGIYGEATRDEAAALADEGIDFLALPRLPDEHN